MILTRSSLYRGLHWGACAILVMLWLGAAGQQAFSPTAYPGVTLPVVMATGAAIILWCLVDAIRTAEQPWALRVAVVFTFGCGVVQWWGAYPPSAPTVLPPLLILASASYGVAGFALGPIGGVVVSVLAAGTIFLARRDLLGTTESALTALPHLTTGCLAALAIAIMARTATKVETALGQVWEERETQARARSLSAASVRWDSLIHDKVLGALRLAARARTPADRAGAAELAADAISSFRVVGSPASLGDLSDAPAMLALVTDDRLAEDGQPWGGDLGWAAPAWFEGQLRRHALRLGLHLHWEVQADGSTAILPSSQARAVMDAAVEALSNVARHSGVDSATASGAFEAGRITLRITDSGRGFDPGQVGAGRAGVSRGIVARVAIVGGTASVRSRPGHGTTVTIDVHAPSPRGPFATTQTWNPLDFVAIFAIAAVALIDYAALALVHADGARSLPVLGACLVFAYLLGTVATFTPRRFAPAAYAAGLGCGVLAFVSTVNLVDPGQIGWHYWFVGITNPTIAVLMFRFPSRWALATVASVVTGIALGQAVSGGVHVGVLVDTSPQLIAFAMASWGIRTALDGATAYLNTAAAGLGRLRVATAALEEADRVAAERTRSLGSRVEAMLRRIAAAEELDASDAARCLDPRPARRRTARLTCRRGSSAGMPGPRHDRRAHRRVALRGAGQRGGGSSGRSGGCSGGRTSSCSSGRSSGRTSGRSSGRRGAGVLPAGARRRLAGGRSPGPGPGSVAAGSGPTVGVDQYRREQHRRSARGARGLAGGYRWSPTRCRPLDRRGIGARGRAPADGSRRGNGRAHRDVGACS